MSQSKVTITRTNNNLGLKAQSEDSCMGLIGTGVAVAGKFALGDVMQFQSLEDAEAMGITTAYDATNTCLMHKHISDFYLSAPKGTKLVTMVVAKTVTQSQMCDVANAYVATLIRNAPGTKPRVVAISRVPDGAYAPTFTTQLEQDTIDCFAKLKALNAALELEYVYTRFILEGRNWQGVVASTLNLRDVATTPDANMVMVMIGNDYDYSNALTGGDIRKKYAAAGLALGRVAMVPVMRSIARVKDLALPGVITAGYSNGAKFSTVTTSQLDTLNDAGYTFLKQHVDIAGFYFNKDYTATRATDDFQTLHNGRVIDKASRIAYFTYVQELENEIYLNPTTGKMAPTTVKSLEGEVERNINASMSSEISGVSAFIDPDQDILSSSILNVEVSIVPVGTASAINIKLGFKNPNL